MTNALKGRVGNSRERVGEGGDGVKRLELAADSGNISFVHKVKAQRAFQRVAEVKHET